MTGSQAMVAAALSGVPAGVQSLGNVSFLALTQVTVEFDGPEANLDRHWANVLEQTAAMHADVCLGLRIPPPPGRR